MDRSLNVATPFTVPTDVVPPSVAPPGFAAIAIVMLRPLSVGTRFPKLSCTCTVIAGLIVCPTVVVVGGCPNPSLFAAPAVIVKAALTAVFALLVAVRFLGPTWLMLRLPNVPIPLASVDCVNVPLNVPDPVVSATVIDRLGTLLPNWSCALTAAVKVTPAWTLDGG